MIYDVFFWRCGCQNFLLPPTTTTPFAIDLAVVIRFNLFSITWRWSSEPKLVSHKVVSDGEVGAAV